MMTSTLRIFFTTSCLSTVTMALHAAERREKTTDILVIDRIPMRRSTVKTVIQGAKLHGFTAVWDCSLPKDDSEGLRPSKRKALTRQFRSKPGFKQVYDSFYKRLRNKQNNSWSKELNERLNGLGIEFNTVEIFSQPMIRLLPSIRARFPKVPVVFFEHGLGDNIDVHDIMKPGDHYLALFGSELNKPQISQLKTDLAPHSNNLKQVFPEASIAFEGLPEGQWTLLATQPLEGFGIDISFWDHFIGLMESHLKAGTTILVKPHPSQEMVVCDHILNALKRRGLKAQLWNDQAATFINLELLVAMQSERFEALFSPFSSSVFYLKKLLPNSSIKCFYSIESLKGFNSNTPDIYKTRWLDLSKRIEQVFGANAMDITS